jgi:rubredoxin
MAEWVAASKIKGLWGGAVPPPLPEEHSSPPLNPTAKLPVAGRGEPVAAQISAGASTDPAITGVCPKCGGRAWSGHVGCLLVFGVILLFPIGLLLLLLPRKWKCLECGYSYTSTNKPYGFHGSSLNL